MVETFYKTNILAEQQGAKVEYYTLALLAVAPKVFIVTKYHGFWRDDLGKSVLNRVVCSTIEQQLSLAEAEKVYAEQKSSLAHTGYVHAISCDHITRWNTNENLSLH
jgi:hypothetical protein